MAIPPLSTGIAGVDNPTVANAFYDGMAKYFTMTKKSQIQDIFVTIYDQATYDDFTTVFSGKKFSGRRATERKDSSSDSDREVIRKPR